MINARAGHAALGARNWRQQGLIEYVPFPPGLLDKYQSYTQADLARLRAAGYTARVPAVEAGRRRVRARELQKQQ